MRSSRFACVGLLLRVGWCAALLFTLAFTHGETLRIAPAAIVWGVVIAVGLAVTGRARYWILPFLLLTVLLIFCYNSAAVFVGYLPFLPLVAVPLCVYVVRFIRRHPCRERGDTLWPLCAVAAATLLAGLFTITAKEYFRPSALYNVLALGPGMVLAYFWFKQELRGEEEQRSFFADLVTWGIACALVVWGYRIWHLAEWVEFWRPPQIQWSNNISTMLMICLPAVFACAKRCYVYMPVGFAVYGAMLLTRSRGAIVLGSAELICVLFWLYLTEKRPIRRLWNGTALILTVMAVTVGAAALLEYGPDIDFSVADEGRMKLLRRSVENFRDAPIFGTGFGYLGNDDLLNRKQGTINWFHMFPAQVLGAMGICGVLAWGYQLFVRARLALRLRKDDSFVFPLCYLGLLLMSMVNPGEFCPLPYGIVAVALFVVAENAAKRVDGLPDQ
ncbi:MAG: O-antigen ligase family protein [Clostridia bacterium]|nr:O-antigen ligase family protein [Clostridia bacterium]